MKLAAGVHSPLVLTVIGKPAAMTKKHEALQGQRKVSA